MHRAEAAVNSGPVAAGLAVYKYSENGIAIALCAAKGGTNQKEAAELQLAASPSDQAASQEIDQHQSLDAISRPPADSITAEAHFNRLKVEPTRLGAG